MPAAVSVYCCHDRAPRGVGPSLAAANEARPEPIELRPAERWPSRRTRSAVQTLRDWPRLSDRVGFVAPIPTLDVHLIHAHSDQPVSKGQIECFFRTVRDRFLSAPEHAETRSLAALKVRWGAWLEGEYHQTPQCPLGVLHQGGTARRATLLDAYANIRVRRTSFWPPNANRRGIGRAAGRAPGPERRAAPSSQPWTLHRAVSGDSSASGSDSGSSTR